MKSDKCPVMCEYNTHVRVCPTCSEQETILISENLCEDARASGIFGSCGTTDNKTSETAKCCWSCRDDGRTQPGKDHHRCVRGK